MGLFHKLFLADIFVVLDHVQAMRKGGWLTRNRLLVSGRESWLVVPIFRAGRGLQRVREMEINYGTHFVRKHLRTIEVNYKKARYFDAFFPMMEEILERRYRCLAELNIEFIQGVCRCLEIPVTFVSSSDLATRHSSVNTGTGNALVLAICDAVGATSYISGTGCLDFIDPRSFDDAGIEFFFQTFDHPHYLQIGRHEFTPNLAILDALLNVGSDNTARMVCQPGKQRFL